MSPTWHSEDIPQVQSISGLGWVRVLWRGTVLGAVVLFGLVLLLLLRLIERPFYGLHRPLTPYITQAVCRLAFFVLGIGYGIRGQQMQHKGAVVANHCSWLDIFALNARKRVYFVSKSEVAAWPGIGWLARATGTLFISRNSRDSRLQKTLFENRLKAGHKLLFFPEGTSTDGRQVLPFKSTLFAAFFSASLKNRMHIQPVTVVYRPPPDEDPRFYGWWGSMAFGAHFLKTLAAAKQGSVEVIYHPPVRVSDFDNRKSLARHCETIVRNGLVQALAATDLT